MAPTLVPMTVKFDDGGEVHVDPKMRDVVGAEEAGHDFAKSGPIKNLYAVAYACIKRMDRAGTLAEDVKVPASFAELLDGADLEVEVDDEDTPGNG